VGPSTFSGVVQDGGVGALGLILQGGKLTLSGANTSSGGTTIGGGTLLVLRKYQVLPICHPVLHRLRFVKARFQSQA
jgi:autotransporter-associated beta strand protein